MTNLPNHPVYAKTVIEMLTVANEYCLFVEKIADYSRDFICGYLQKVLPLMYIKGALLPEVEVSDPDLNERFFTQEEWEAAFHSIRPAFQSDDEFWYLVVAVEKDYNTARGSIAEFMTDIYADLKDFLALYQKNSIAAKENAVSECRKLFLENWGGKTLNLHKAIHDLIMKSLEKDDYLDRLN